MRPTSLLPLFGVSSALSTPINETKNANHIFNTIQDSMRQWGSSLHHNGVSYFLARVPAGTQFYHGTSKDTPVIGTEWLAFEPEHAMVFARPLVLPLLPLLHTMTPSQRVVIESCASARALKISARPMDIP